MQKRRCSLEEVLRWRVPLLREPPHLRRVKHARVSARVVRATSKRLACSWRAARARVSWGAALLRAASHTVATQHHQNENDTQATQ